ncbi:lysis protein [Phytobacter diazotrophicus]|jgi:prophage endopeptidase|uniref:Endopeptidase n=1 Tax=Phytobacter diazotrophicus TaxID=395631 RepID=A0ABN6LV31_9ENTR|nr:MULTISPECIES: lysis protein [Phytobacter]MDU4994973.1 lysis protein [Enterobacteriaceae bacterium]PTA90391.1 lysis protein [Kluyvera sp. Nf5]QIH64301.1 lysis protein [Enterobacteriaceae bacterium A-F18]MDU7199803.1 lysis protein [Enterobacteriaceae bacterium]BBE78719.1 endopeptidase [Phytobacter sp. MRY16-398]
MTPKAWLIIGAELLLSLLLIYILFDQISTEKKRADDATSLAKQRQETIDDMTVRQRDVATLDAKYTGELADAKKQLENLQRCVSTGKCGLHINAKCPANGTTSATGMDDATGPRLTDAAERDYFTLRERIETITKQLTGLQQYVREQCLK